MTNMAIIVEKVMKPEIFSNALQKEINTVQVHRRNNFWDYKAVEAAQAELSLTAFQLYMYNTFPWPTPTDAQKAKIEQTAQAMAC